MVAEYGVEYGEYGGWIWWLYQMASDWGHLVKFCEYKNDYLTIIWSLATHSKDKRW